MIRDSRRCRAGLTLSLLVGEGRLDVKVRLRVTEVNSSSELPVCSASLGFKVEQEKTPFQGFRQCPLWHQP